MVNFTVLFRSTATPMFSASLAVVLSFGLNLVSCLPSNLTVLRQVAAPAAWTNALTTSKLQDPHSNPAAANTTKYIESSHWTLFRDSSPGLNQYLPDNNVTFNTDDSGFPYPTDVLQGSELGDCYLAASLRAVASRSPDSIKQALRPLNRTQLHLRVFLQIDGATYTTIDVSIDDTYQQDPGLFSLQVFQAPSGMDIIWPVQIEKALAKLMAFCIAQALPCDRGRLQTDTPYADLSGGDPSATMFMLTGRRFDYLIVQQLTDTDILNVFALADSQPCALSTSSNNTGFLYPNHSHWIVGTQGCLLFTSNPFESANRQVTIADIRAQVDVLHIPADVDFSSSANLSCLNDPALLRPTPRNTTA